LTSKGGEDLTFYSLDDLIERLGQPTSSGDSGVVSPSGDRTILHVHAGQGAPSPPDLVDATIVSWDCSGITAFQNELRKRIVESLTLEDRLDPTQFFRDGDSGLLFTQLQVKLSCSAVLDHESEPDVRRFRIRACPLHKGVFR